MNKSDIDMLVKRWLNEPHFRKQMRTDPVKTIQSVGCQLEEGDIKALGQIDWKLPDDELQKRASKLFV